MDSNPYQLFHTRVIEAIQSAEVMSLMFPRFGKVLVLDLRHTIEIPPWVEVDDMVGSAEIRLTRLEKRRPLLPLPEELRIAAWIGSMESLHDTGVADAILARCAETGQVDIVGECREAFRELAAHERHHLIGVMNGTLSRTIWQRDQ